MHHPFWLPCGTGALITMLTFVDADELLDAFALPPATDT